MFSSIFDGTLIPETQCPCLIDSQLSSLPDKLRRKWLVEDVVNLIFSHVYDDPLYHSNTQRELVSTVHVAARAFQEHVDDLHKPYWHRVTKMLENFRVIHEHAQLALSCSRRDPERHKKSYQDYAKSQLNEMQAGDVLVFHGSSSRDAVTFQKDATCVLYESLCIANRHGTSCLVFTPGMGIEIPPQVFDNGNFLHELALSLSDGKLPTPILLSVGHPVKPKCTLAAEHVDPDEIQSNFWSRSNTWLLIKAAIQLSLDHSPLSRSTYKAFILFLMCNLAQYAANIDIEIIHCILLHSMSTKILRRLRKLGASVPQWLYNTVSEACATVSRTLDQRRREVQATLCTSPSWDPLQLDLIRDIQHTMTLPHIHEHASASHASHDHPLPHTFFLPVCRPRGTLHRFLSHLGEFSCDDDIHVVLHDVEQAVMDDLADWATSVRVTSIEESCEQLAALTYWYHSSALTAYHYDATKQRGRSDPDCQSIMFLTITELWIALDMLVLKEVPILADYSPEVPMNLLCQLLLHDTKSIHHFRRAYQYLSTRHSRARPGWSVFSNEFTKDSFPCRYYNSSPHLQHLTASIQDMLPCDPFHAKAVIFELQSPMFLDKWRSVTSLLHRIGLSTKPDGDTSLDEQGAKLGEGDVPVCDIPTMKPYVLQECRSRSSLLYSACAPQHWDRLYYFLECSPSFGFKPHYKSGMQMEKYVRDTMHTSNEVLAAQADRDHDLSRREFIAFGHVRSGGSLQWLNILQGLRSRTLKFHDKDVYVLLAQATAQVGPLDQTGELLWHQEIQDPSFCHTLLDVLEGLFNEVGAGLLDGPAMATISLLAGVLASSGTLDTSERAIQLLRNVRTKTLEWVHQLLYHSRRSTEDVQGLSLLQEMAMVCRSTFYVGSAATHRLFRSAQDIEAALCCTMLIQTNPQSHSDFPSYSQVLLNRNHHLSLVLEECLRDAIQADVSDLGVDRAVQTVWPGYRPGPCRWEPLPLPNSRWLVCETTSTNTQRSQTVYVDLLSGSILVDAKPINVKLPQDVTDNPSYRALFGHRDLMVVTSDMPGMRFATVSVIHQHYVHFGVQYSGDDPEVIIRAENTDSGDIYELVPRRELLEHLPGSLLDHHVYWRNLSTYVIEIRPVKNPWMQSSGNWKIHPRNPNGQFHVTKGSEFLVNRQSPTWTMVSSCFRRLEDPEHFIITALSVDMAAASPSSSLQLSIILPACNLSFFVNEVGNLESRDFKDMVYDEDQDIGALAGLFSCLVLRPGHKVQIEDDFLPKCIIIPKSYYLDTSCSFNQSIPYYVYQADKELGRLKGITGSESPLFLARLHYQTGLQVGSCRPDALTGRVGIEEAVSLVWLAGEKANIPSHSSESWKSPQIRFALENFAGPPSTYKPRPPGGDYLLPEALREAYLFPSEATNAHLSRKLFSVSLDQLLYERPPPDMHQWERNTLPPYNGSSALSQVFDVGPLRQLFSSLRTNATAPPFQNHYIAQLHDSAHHLQTAPSGTLKISAPFGINDKPSIRSLRAHYVQCRFSYKENLKLVKNALYPRTEFDQLLDQCGQWPRITPFILFRCLASTSPIKLTDSWTKCLTTLALLALDVQQARRLLQFSLNGFEEELDHELQNKGCDGWDANEHPDWLLIQLQGNFLIRRVQVDCAKEMMSPRSGMNTIMQVNMGEGKTSVIIPICAAALADGNRLIRIIVPKALIPQTLQVLYDRLGGLVGRSIYHLTFRRSDTNDSFADLQPGKYLQCLHAFLRKCRRDRSIIVMQPEHALSLKLACVETWTRTASNPGRKPWLKRVLHRLKGSINSPLTGRTRVSTSEDSEGDGVSEQSPNWRTRCIQDEILELLVFLETHTQDILDESDEVLRPQTQLIYAIGHEHPLEGYPDRWLVIQQVLELVKRHAHLLSASDSLAISSDGDSLSPFPHIHILRAEGGELLASLVANDILEGRLSGLRFHSELGIKAAVREFILRKDIHRTTVRTVEKYARQTTSWGSLLLLRGLFAENILLFALTQRRWRVDYGLPPHSWRTMLAIPYRAKDVPSETAEFGHPDLTILLTCFAYYYKGLTEKQLRTTFDLMQQQDDPSGEYALWLDYGTASVPSALRNLSGIIFNRSLDEWDRSIFPLFTRNTRAINLYLSKVVFPRHAQEFPHKLLASYWDIAEKKNHLVTGFSGTNDGQYLLPTSIAQDDPEHLHQTATNARVLSFLLQPENASYVVTSNEHGQRWTTLELLRVLVAQNPEIRVLLDVGAQILDLSNGEVARAWLDCIPSTGAAGAIYFNENDQLRVLGRDGTAQPLSSSLFAHQLHRCVAYLDHSHTRGTDLKFPRGFRAAVTLGHKLTKDPLVQGCMRMRKLGNGHSVMFFAPLEVDQRIRLLVAKEDQNIQVTTADVLHWTIRETWNDIQRRAPFWAQEGISHRERSDTWSRFRCDTTHTTLKALADAWVRPETKSLADMYMPCQSRNTTSSTTLPFYIRERCENLGVLSLPNVDMEEEREREVSREVEREREVERPLAPSPARHILHPDVVRFVTTGVLPSPSKSKAFRYIFPGIISTFKKPHGWSTCLLATADFCETISEDSVNATVQGGMSDYMRPVQWVLSGKMDGKDALVLVSPYEADRLMPEIRLSKHVHLHLYIPRTTKRMEPSDDLMLYSIPPLPSDWTPPWTLIDQLNVFAGQLYLRDHASYLRLCRFIGVHSTDDSDVPAAERTGTVVMRNWFRNPNDADEGLKDRFKGTQVLAAMRLLAARGSNLGGTHMGRILDGWPLAQNDFASASQITEVDE